MIVLQGTSLFLPFKFMLKHDSVWDNIAGADTNTLLIPTILNGNFCSTRLRRYRKQLGVVNNGTNTS